MADKDVGVDDGCAPSTSEPLAPGDVVEVYFWSRREWRTGRFEIDEGDAFIEILGSRLRYEAAMLMGLRRVLH